MHIILAKLKSGVEVNLAINDSAGPISGVAHGWVAVKNAQNIPLEVRLKYSELYFK